MEPLCKEIVLKLNLPLIQFNKWYNWYAREDWAKDIFCRTIFFLIPHFELTEIDLFTMVRNPVDIIDYCSQDMKKRAKFYNMCSAAGNFPPIVIP